MKNLILDIILSIVIFSSSYSDILSYEIKNGKVYYIENDFRGEIKDADLKTFEALNSIFSKDKKHVYYAGQILENTHPDSIKNLEDVKEIKKKILNGILNTKS